MKLVMSELQGKRILITGAGKRIGRAMAVAVANAGADVAIHYSTSADSALEVAEEIKALGREAFLVQADLQDATNLSSIIEKAFLGLGSLDALINNAAIFENLDWQTTNLENWNRHFVINLTAPFFLAQAFAKRLPKGQQGRIINILDWRALRPSGDHLPYTISRAALAALTKSLAVSFAPHILVNGIALGAILPPSDGAETADILNNIPMQRWARLDDVAEVLIFLLSAPDYITGEIIHVDGGRHLM